MSSDQIDSVLSALMKYFVYILRTSSNTLYIGQTNNLEKRIREHESKSTKSAKYTRYFNSFKLVHSESFNTRSEAMKREWQLKQWPRKKKEALIIGNLTLLRNNRLEQNRKEARLGNRSL